MSLMNAMRVVLVTPKDLGSESLELLMRLFEIGVAAVGAGCFFSFELLLGVAKGGGAFLFDGRAPGLVLLGCDTEFLIVQFLESRHGTLVLLARLFQSLGGLFNRIGQCAKKRNIKPV